jgi:hypothetical protein
MEELWFKDINGLFGNGKYMKFLPSKEFSYVENLNAIVRFSIYFGIIAFVIQRDSRSLMVPIVTLLATFFMAKTKEKNDIHEQLFLDNNRLEKDKITDEICQRPTENNPFMNVMMNDYYQNPQRKRACDITKPHVRKEADRFFNKNLYRSVSDIFNKEASDRQWVTNPITTIPNDQNSFAKWCYQTPPSCKERNGTQCWNNLYQARA